MKKATRRYVAREKHEATKEELRAELDALLKEYIDRGGKIVGEELK